MWGPPRGLREGWPRGAAHWLRCAGKRGRRLLNALSRGVPRDCTRLPKEALSAGPPGLAGDL